MTRIGFVGSGAIARVHAGILRAEGATLDTVVGLVPKETAAFAAEFGFRHHTTDLDAMLSNDEIQAVWITTPSPLHSGQSKRALMAGKHVISEIPLAMSYAAGVELVELARRQNRRLMVCHTQRFNPSLAALYRRVQEGSLHVYHFLVRFGDLRRNDIGWTGIQRDWLDNILWHTGCHFVDCGMWFLNATEVQVVANVRQPDAYLGIPMDIDVLIRTARDQLINVTISYNSHLKFHEYVIIGHEESFALANGVLRGPEGILDDPSARGVNYLELGWQAQDREFLAALRQDREAAVSGSDVLPALKVLQEIQDRYMPAGTVQTSENMNIKR